MWKSFLIKYILLVQTRKISLFLKTAYGMNVDNSH